MTSNEAPKRRKKIELGAGIDYSAIIGALIDGAKVYLSDKKPSDWTEESVIMDKPFPGPFSYSRTPYSREIIDRASYDDPAQVVAVMKGAQIGISGGVIYPALGYMIKNAPSNSFLAVGHEDLVEEAMQKVDLLIDNAGLRPLIRSSVQRKKGGKTGDTNTKKEFPGGYLIVSHVNNHKTLRQRDLQLIVLDDYESAKRASAESGDTLDLVQQRQASYGTRRKLFLISSPELKGSSNIEEAYLKGDQRRYMIPCPCCGTPIALEWEIFVEGKRAGITYHKDEEGSVIRDSVGYTCQECLGFFDDSNKGLLLNSGFWQPTAKKKKDGYYSYHLSSLYAPAGMFDWYHYATQWEEANPDGKKRHEQKYKTFLNVVLGQTYEETGAGNEAKEMLSNNITNYQVGVIPDLTSEKHGNGKICLITFAADMNGVVDDARIDWEIVAHTETGSSYSIMHGSAGTFVPMENSLKNKQDRARYSYELNVSNSVWPLIGEIISRPYAGESGKNYKIMVSGIDTGYNDTYAWAFIDSFKGGFVVGLKGKDEEDYVKQGPDTPMFQLGKSRSKLYILNVNQIKDELHDLMNMKYNPGIEYSQPAGFVNFPESANGLYTYKGYFSQFEAEHRVVKEGTNKVKWVKKARQMQNHFWDCKVYNLALRDIIGTMVCRENKIPYSWKDYCDIILGRR